MSFENTRDRMHVDILGIHVYTAEGSSSSNVDDSSPTYPSNDGYSSGSSAYFGGISGENNPVAVSINIPYTDGESE